MDFIRTYSFFDPDYTYRVKCNGVTIGHVARIGNRWHASSKTWNDGQDFPETFKTRRAAAEHLWHNKTEQISLLLGIATADDQ